MTWSCLPIVVVVVVTDLIDADLSLENLIDLHACKYGIFTISQCNTVRSHACCHGACIQDERRGQDGGGFLPQASADESLVSRLIFVCLSWHKRRVVILQDVSRPGECFVQDMFVFCSNARDCMIASAKRKIFLPMLNSYVPDQTAWRSTYGLDSWCSYIHRSTRWPNSACISPSWPCKCYSGLPELPLVSQSISVNSL